MTGTKPRRRLSADVKRVLFVVGVLWLVVHLLCLAVTLTTRQAMPFAAVLCIDVCAGLVAGLVWTAYRIFPTNREGDRP